MTAVYDAGSTNEELLGLLKRMDQDFAWERFLATYQPMIRQSCRSFRLNPHEIDEVESMVMGRLLSFFRRTENRVKLGFRGFLATLIRNEVKDFFRRKKREVFLPLDFADDYAEQVAMPREFQESMEELESQITHRMLLIQRSVELVRKSVDERTWQIFWDYGILNHSPADVAERYGVSLSAVFKYRKRVSDRLKHQWETHCDEPE